MILKGRTMKNGTGAIPDGITSETNSQGSRSHDKSSTSSEQLHKHSPITPENQTESQKIDAVNELLGGSEKAPAPAGETGRPAADKIEADELLFGEDDGSGGTLEDEKPAALAPGTPPKTLEAAALALGIEVKDLYAMQIGIDDKTDPSTLGALKDAFKDQETIAREGVERSAELDQRETAMIAEQRLWGQVGEQLGQNLAPGTRDQLLEQLEGRDRIERARMVQLMPELADRANFDQFRNDVVKELGVYGYKPHEVSIGDHRQLLVVRDLMRAKKRLAALAKFKLKPTKQQLRKPKGRGKPPDANAARIKHAKTGTESDKIKAIAGLIN